MSSMDDYKLLRSYAEDCFDNPLHDETWPCRVTKPKKKGGEARTDFACTGPGIPGYFSPDKCQVLFVTLCPTEKEVASTKKLRAPFIDAYGARLDGFLKEAEMYGDARLGFSTLLKCHLNNKRTLKKVVASCKDLLENEIDLVQPIVVVCIGETVAKFMAPELFQEGMIPPDGYSGQAYQQLDRVLYFMRDPEELYGANGVKDKEKNYVAHMYVRMLEEIKDYLIPNEQWVMEKKS